VKGLPAVARRLTKPMPKVGQTPADVVHTENKWRLLRYRPRPEGPAYRTPVLMVPALINRWYVLDLMPRKSFIEWLVARGHDVFMIDWGAPGPEDRYLTFDDVADRYLGRALRIAARSSDRGQAHLLGYCMGGILTAVHTAAHPDRVASLVQIAAPVRFDGDGLLGTWTRTRAFDVGALVSASGNAPHRLLQGAFHMLRPTLILSKVAYLLEGAWDDQALDGFLALETWGNDNVSVPGEFFRRYIAELYRGDALVRGTFTLSGRPVRLEAIRCPLVNVTFDNDWIVPWRSAAALLDHVSSVDRTGLHLKGGHVGAVVSSRASQSLWPQLAAFWAARDEGEAPGDRISRATAALCSVGTRADQVQSRAPLTPTHTAS
jgi:polyhydroxyalkanoate synthase